MAASAPPARPPAHYRVLPVAREQILLQLTVSNRCGQAFRWRANEVWEYIGDEELGPPLKSEPETPVKREPDAETAHVKSETDGSAAHVKAENGSAHASTSLKGWEQQTEWSLCLSDRVVLLRQDEARGYLYFRTLLPSGTDTADVELVESQTRSWLHDYLNLSVPLEALYKEWSLKDPVFRRFATRFAGVRMLQQEPWECLCAFICSSNNNIARIGQMVQALCTHYSEPLLEYSYPAPPDALLAASPDLKSGPTRIVYHPFPSAATLAQPGVEETLKQLSFGYRAKYIAATARALCEAHPHAQRQVSPPLALKPEPALLEAEAEPRRGKRARQEAKLSSAEMKDNKTSQETKAEPEAPPPSIHSPASYLLTLRDMPYHEARAELLKLSGVGPKVAECVCWRGDWAADCAG
jgi:N-glycosylase/DNA lyase